MVEGEDVVGDDWKGHVGAVVAPGQRDHTSRILGVYRYIQRVCGKWVWSTMAYILAAKYGGWNVIDFYWGMEAWLRVCGCATTLNFFLEEADTTDEDVHCISQVLTLVLIGWQ